MLSGSEQFKKDADQLIEYFLIHINKSAMKDGVTKNQLIDELLANMHDLIDKVEPGDVRHYQIKTDQVDKLLEYKCDGIINNLRNMGFKISKPSYLKKQIKHKGNSTGIPKEFIDPKGGINYKTIEKLVINDLENKNMHDYKSQEMVINNMRVIEKPEVKGMTRFTSTAAVVSPNYGVKFKSGQDSLADPNTPTNEINILFMGTGGTIHVGGEHKDVYEGGDVLCHLGLHKGIEQNQPTLLIRGIGTNDDFKTATDYYSKKTKNANTAGNISETALAYGLNQRLCVSMEQFFIPNLLQMIEKKSTKNELPCDFTFNVAGHSRGAITSYAMVDLIDAWMNEIEKMSDKDIELMAKKIATEFPDATKSKSYDGKPLNEKGLNSEQIARALKVLRDKKVNFKTKLMIYDPVEGDFACGDTVRTSKVTTNIYGKELVCNYGNIPKSVKNALIFLGFDERRVTFQPTVSLAEDPKSTNVAIQPVIGVHGTLKGYFSKFSDEGQDSYIAQQGSVFLKEALRASADLVKAKSCKFMFDSLPSFETVTICNIFFSNNGQGYVSTKKHLLESILNHLNETQANQFTLSELENNLYDMFGAEELIALCKDLMAKDQTLSKQLYFDLESDVYKIYLNPKNEDHANQLRELREEMRLDSMAVLPRGNQPADESRYVWIRNKNSPHADRNPDHYMNKKFTTLAYNPFSDIWSPPPIRIGRSLGDGFSDPFYFNLLDAFNENEVVTMSREEYEIIRKFSYDFADLNEKGALYAENRENVTAAKNYTTLRDDFTKKIISSKISDNLKAKTLAILKMKEDHQYKISISHLGSCIDAIKDHQLKNACLSEMANYQIGVALELTENKNLINIPQLHYEINTLINNLNKSISQTNDITFAQYQKLKKANNTKGREIVKNHLSAKLTYWKNTLQNYNTHEIETLFNKIKYEQDVIKKSKLYVENNINIKTNKPLTPNEIKEQENIQYTALNEIKACESKIKLIPILIEQLVNNIEEMQQQIQNHNDFNDLVNIDKNIEAFINDCSKIKSLKQRINSNKVASDTIFESVSMGIADKFMIRKSYYQKDEDKKVANAILKNGYKNFISRDNRIALITNQINKNDPNIFQCFLTAAKEGNVKEFAEYIAACKNTGIRGNSFSVSITQPRDPNGNSALHLIAKSGNLGLWQIVVDSGYVSHGIGLTNSFNWTPDTIFDFTAKNKNGLTPIMVAVKAGNIKLVEEMRPFYKSMPKEQFDKLLNRAKSKAIKGSGKAILTSKLRHTTVNSELVKKEELVNEINKNNKTVFESFLAAVLEENTETVKQYIEACKNSSTKFVDSIDSARDIQGNTALHLIAKSGNIDLWKVVADSTYKQNYSIRWTYPYHIFNFMLENDYGLNPLEVAVKAGNVEIVKGMKEIYQALDSKKYSDSNYKDIVAQAELNQNYKANKRSLK